MTCRFFNGAIICFNPSYRLRTDDGGYVYMEWHHYCGPAFYKDKRLTKEVEEWWENEYICKALDWFIHRGERA